MQHVVATVPKEERISAKLLEAALRQPGAPTAADLADRIGVDVGTMSRWRRDVTPLSRTKWIAILAVLGLPLDWKPAKGTAAAKPAKRGRGRPRGTSSTKGRT